MGFGFNLFFISILIPLTIILLIAWLATKKNIYEKAVGFIWMGVVGLVTISLTIHAAMAKKVLKKEDFMANTLSTEAISEVNKLIGNMTTFVLR